MSSQKEVIKKDASVTESFKYRVHIFMKNDRKKENYHKRMIAYAYFSSIGEEEIDRFLRYTKIDLNKQQEIDVKVRMIQHVLECVHELTELGDDSAALIDVLIEFDFDSWQSLLSEYPNCFTEEEIVAHVLQSYFHKEDWERLFGVKDPLRTVTNKMMSLFSLLGLMDWWDVVDLSQGVGSRLDFYSSFRDAIYVFLNVYADNIGFDAEEDQKDLVVLRVFLNEIIAEK